LGHSDLLTYSIDIDGTICVTNGNDYRGSRPNRNIIDRINDIYDKGHTIKIFTARGSSSGIDWRDFTEHQLQSWGVKYHELILGKPSCDIIVDDKALCIEAFLKGGCPLRSA